MSAYYNENDPKAVAWLRELIKGGHIAPGDVDERSIEDVRPEDLAGYTQCHFFAGIGGWSLALQLAGWPADREVWTGSCPCQPFSAAGKGKGFADERHLWPAWLWLARQRRPSVIFGEQVANAVQWIDLVQGDLEAEGYFVGYAVLGAHSVGAPHIRQRLYWVGHAAQHGRGALYRQSRTSTEQQKSVGRSGVSSGLADAGEERCIEYAQRICKPFTGVEASCWTDAGGRSHFIECRAGQLNPEFSRWLMGYPAVWGSCGATAMQSSPKSRLRSSKPAENWLDF
jgi:DNA (cytosine-5)-methyltransferase 1